MTAPRPPKSKRLPVRASKPVKQLLQDAALDRRVRAKPWLICCAANFTPAAREVHAVL